MHSLSYMYMYMQSCMLELFSSTGGSGGSGGGDGGGGGGSGSGGCGGIGFFGGNSDTQTSPSWFS